jgi:glycosyltransferase involved in cell wall biosynthesis
MRVLILLNRGGVGGGHVVQATKTVEKLRSLGINAALSEALEHDFRGADVVHTFAAPAEVLRRARGSGAAIVVSPIWWSADYRYAQAYSHRSRLGGALYGARIAHSAIRRGIDETARRLREPLTQKALLFELADLLLPNSLLEAQQIRADLGVTTPMHVVPNGFDEHVFTPPESDTPRMGVAFVGRIEPHKNQLGLIRELEGTGIPLTIAGPVHPDHTAYGDLCRRTADASVTFVPGGDEIAVRDVYRSALVHAMPSWFETTGLSSLEAAATGCAVVTTNRGYVHEYFGEHAVYCDPGEKGSIRQAVRNALVQGPPGPLRPLVLDRFTWAHAAKATLEGYKIALRTRAVTLEGP